MPRTKAGYNFDGSLSFFDRVVFPTASKAYAGKMEQQLNSNVAATTYNPNFQGSEIDRQQQSAAIQESRVDRFNAAEQAYRTTTNIQDQLLGRPALTGPGATDNAVRSIRGVPGAQEGPSPVGPGVQTNPFVGSRQQQEFAGQVQARSQANTQKAAQEWLALSRKAKDLPPYRLEQANREFAQRYPEFAQMNPLRAISPEEAAKVEGTIKLTQAQAKFDEFAQKQGVPSVPLVLNEKGIPEAPAWWNTHVDSVTAAQRESSKLRADQRKLREQMYQNEVSSRRALSERFQKEARNPYSPAEDYDSWVGFEQFKESNLKSLSEFETDTRKKYFPEEFQDVTAPVPPRPVSRERLGEARQIATNNGLQKDRVVASQEDLDAFQSDANRTGESFQVLDSSTGKLEWINPRR